MRPRGETWAIVLAGGQGTRLRGFSGRDGSPNLPKQFRRLDGGPSLLARTLERCARIVPPSRTVAVLAQDQRHWWEPEIGAIPPANRIVQPCDRGTGVALLAATLLIHLRSPEARIVSFPSDHAVRDENLFADAVEAGLSALDADPDRLLLLGAAPDDDTEGYGWIVPGDPIPGGGRLVVGFEEKPEASRVAELRSAGALIDTFVLSARTRGVLHLFRQGAPALLDEFLAGIIDGGDTPTAFVRHYDRLPRLDIGRELFETAPERLAVLPIPECGWIDLGTPKRADRWLAEFAPAAPHPSPGRTS